MIDKSEWTSLVKDAKDYKKWFWMSVPKNKINQIKKIEIDILLGTGSVILKEDILNSSKFGILWSS